MKEGFDSPRDRHNMTNFYVYLIITVKNKKYYSYVGYTVNLKNRIKRHNESKGAKYTRGRKWKLAYFKKYHTKNIAMREEYKLKKNYKLRNKIKSDFIHNENINTITI